MLKKNLCLTFACLTILATGVLFAAPITIIDVPGAKYTYLAGISNNGVAVGAYTTAAGAIYGFEVLPDGTLVYPFSDPSDTTSVTRFFGIDNAGTIVGQYGTFPTSSFIFAGGAYSAFSVAGCNFPGNWGITAMNDAGDVAGSCGTFAAFGPQNGYIQTNGNAPVVFSPSGAAIVQVHAINNLDQIAGEYLVAGLPSYIGYGYIRNADGSYTTVIYPGALSGTAVTGINDAGEIVGYWQVVNGGELKAFYGTPGNLIPFSFTIPGAGDLLLSGINDSGQVVGYYGDDSGGQHGFIASVAIPEPSTMPLCGTALLGVALLIMRRS